MKRLFLGLLLVCLGSGAHAATVTLLNQTFYVEMVAKRFSKPQYYDPQDREFYPFPEANTLPWGQLGISYGGPDLGMRYLVNVIVQADESLRVDSFSLTCTLPGAFFCGSFSFIDGRFDGTTVELWGGGSSTSFSMSISRFGGTSFFENDAWGGGTLPDGRIWLYEDGFARTAAFTPVPLPSAAWMLISCLCVFAALGRRRAG